MKLLSTHDDIADKNELKPFDFYIDLNKSNNYLVLFDYIKEEVFLLHRRMKEVQTLEYIDDGATLELSELMFVHDRNDCVRIFERKDDLNGTEDEAICREMEIFKTYKLSFEIIKLFSTSGSEGSEEETDINDFFDAIAKWGCVKERREDD